MTIKIGIRFGLIGLIAICCHGAQEPSAEASYEKLILKNETHSLEVQLGKLKVPLCYKKHSGELSISFIRLPSTAEKPGVPIIYLAGGPGESGLAAVAGDPDAFKTARAIAEVVVFDQRGVGKSGGLGLGQIWTYPQYKPTNRAELLKIMTANAAASVKDLDLSMYHTPASVEDLEQLRKVLAVPKLALLGASYGSHLALAYIKRYPQYVERAVLAAVEGLDHTMKLPKNTQAVLEELDGMAEEWGDGKPGEFLKNMELVLADLEKTPRVIDYNDGYLGISRFDVERFTAAYLSQARLMKKLPGLYRDMAKDDFSKLASDIAALKTGRFSLMNMAVDIASGASNQRLKAIAEQYSQTLLGDIMNFPHPQLNKAFGVKPLPENYRSAAKGSMPVLFISGSLDAHTPPANVEAIIGGFPKGSHLLVTGAGHRDLFATPGVANLTLAFLRGETVSDTVLVAP